MKNIIEINNLNVSSKRENQTILRDISLTLQEGLVYQLKGRNGSGKSTLLKTLILDEINKFKVSGEIRFLSYKNILKLKKEKELIAIRSSISYVPQIDDYTGYNKLTVRDVISDSIESFNGKRVEINELEPLFNSFDFDDVDGAANKFDLNSKPSELSGGQQRILSIIANVLGRPAAKIYIIDEPLNNLDYKNIPLIISLIKKIKIDYPTSTFLIVTHHEMFDFIDEIIEI